MNKLLLSTSVVPGLLRNPVTGHVPDSDKSLLTNLQPLRDFLSTPFHGEPGARAFFARANFFFSLSGFHLRVDRPRGKIRHRRRRRRRRNRQLGRQRRELGRRSRRCFHRFVNPRPVRGQLALRVAP